MTLRITENQTVNSMINSIQRNRQDYNKYSQQAASGLKVVEVGDSTFSGTISELKTTSQRLSGYTNRVNSIQSYFEVQDEVLDSANSLLIRAKEIAEQGANETYDTDNRAALAAEVVQLRDHLVSLANTKYQGQYIYSGTATDVPAYGVGEDTFVEGEENTKENYVYQGNEFIRKAQITDTLQIDLNTPGKDVFGNAITALEKLARSLQGYKTVIDETTGEIDVTNPDNVAYTFPDDYHTQTDDIRECLDLLDKARQEDISTERVDVAGRLNRITSAQSLLGLDKTSNDEALSKLQDADMVEVASKFNLAEDALSASMMVTTRMLNISILDYI